MAAKVPPCRIRNESLLPTLTPRGQAIFVPERLWQNDQRSCVSTVHGLKQALMNAKLIASGDPGSSASGRYFANLIERLQIADAIKPKIKTFSSGTAALEAVANGEADVAIWVISSANGPGTELAGVLPAQAKKFNSYAAGILTNSNRNCPGWFAAWSARLTVAGQGLLGA